MVIPNKLPPTPQQISHTAILTVSDRISNVIKVRVSDSVIVSIGEGSIFFNLSIKPYTTATATIYLNMYT